MNYKELWINIKNMDDVTLLKVLEKHDWIKQGMYSNNITIDDYRRMLCSQLISRGFKCLIPINISELMGKDMYEIELEYDQLFYSLDNIICNKYGIWNDKISKTIINYMRRKAELLSVLC